MKNEKMNKGLLDSQLILDEKKRLNEQRIGREEHKREQIAEMLQDGKTPEEIASFCKYPMKLIEEVQNSMMSVK
ncbi:hypothetical protein SAMN05216349_1107 [Oribacterium sp. KHPX15]|uniref:hypothetical protein n=1 Tax=unclassified Oribacterium TaxID=2629782 RepID=UPI0004E0F1A6|nr:MULTISPECIES: hypothetical protein [unclassified Oribacterium]SEA34814.1 hypothetical protein SAMN05216349_1107 [Oribacterium sp. KHPX15]